MKEKYLVFLLKKYIAFHRIVHEVYATKSNRRYQEE